MTDPKTLELINALLANRADTPSRPRSLSSLSQGLFGLDSGLGALSSIPPPPRLRGVLEQVLAKSEHDRLVEKLHAWLVSNWFCDIRVDLPGHVKPTKIVWTDTQRGHEPDATAYYGLRQYVFEVETADTLGDDHTHEQCRLFTAFARERFAEFVLVVPTGCGSAATWRLSWWGLRAAVLEV